MHCDLHQANKVCQIENRVNLREEDEQEMDSEAVNVYLSDDRWSVHGWTLCLIQGQATHKPTQRQTG